MSTRRRDTLSSSSGRRLQNVAYGARRLTPRSSRDVHRSTGVSCEVIARSSSTRQHPAQRPYITARLSARPSLLSALLAPPLAPPLWPHGASARAPPGLPSRAQSPFWPDVSVQLFCLSALRREGLGSRVGGREVTLPSLTAAARAGRKRRRGRWAAWRELRTSRGRARAPRRGSSCRSNTSRARSSPSGWPRRSPSRGSSSASSPTTRSASSCC